MRPRHVGLGRRTVLVSCQEGNATSTTLGRANGIVATTLAICLSTKPRWSGGQSPTTASRTSFRDPVIRAQSSPTSMAVSVACLPAILVRPRFPDMTYAMPFWWLLERIQARVPQRPPRCRRLHQRGSLFGLSLFSLPFSRTYN